MALRRILSCAAPLIDSFASSCNYAQARSYHIYRHVPKTHEAVRDFAMTIWCGVASPSMPQEGFSTWGRDMQDGYLLGVGMSSKEAAVPMVKAWRDASAPTDKASLLKWLGADGPRPTPTVEVGFGTRVALNGPHPAGIGRLGRVVAVPSQVDRDPGFPCVQLEGPDAGGVQFASEHRLVVVCEACGKASEDIKSCSGCKHTFYCSEACQQAHSDAHKSTCK
ncbi:hypothetical protein FOA52_013428 [Chlamydomonas sp. UWO 241]|nr:hypothetical protein FOA52_013428 [Chlamydomonas sp. UWO 241]